MADKKSPSGPAAKPGDPLDLGTSVAGEEDPGASLDVPPATVPRVSPPADQPPPGTPGTGQKP